MFARNVFASSFIILRNLIANKYVGASSAAASPPDRRRPLVAAPRPGPWHFASFREPIQR